MSIVNSRGDHLRAVTREAARILVDNGTARPVATAGAVRAIELARPAASYAERVGEPTGNALTGTRFYRRAHLEESTTRIFEHHPRALYER